MGIGSHEGVWRRFPTQEARRTHVVQRQFTHRGIQKGGAFISRVKKIFTTTKKGKRIDQLKNLALILARQIDEAAQDPDGGKVLSSLSKEYRLIIKEIEDIEGVDDDDEIGAILSERKADGKSDSVR